MITADDIIQRFSTYLLVHFKESPVMPVDTGYLRTSLESHIDGNIITLIPLAPYAFFVQFVPHASPHDDYLMRIFQSEKDAAIDYLISGQGMLFDYVNERIEEAFSGFR
jgi:hypothetical protein